MGHPRFVTFLGRPVIQGQSFRRMDEAVRPRNGQPAVWAVVARLRGVVAPTGGM